MWYGKMTPTLEKLYDEYYKMWGIEPEGYIELEYGPADYREYVRDIKTAIKLKKELPDVCK